MADIDSTKQPLNDNVYYLIIVLVVVFLVWLIFSPSGSSSKQQAVVAPKSFQEVLDSLKGVGYRVEDSVKVDSSWQGTIKIPKDKPWFHLDEKPCKTTVTNNDVAKWSNAKNMFVIDTLNYQKADDNLQLYVKAINGGKVVFLIKTDDMRRPRVRFQPF